MSKPRVNYNQFRWAAPALGPLLRAKHDEGLHNVCGTVCTCEAAVKARRRRRPRAGSDATWRCRCGDFA